MGRFVFAFTLLLVLLPLPVASGAAPQTSYRLGVFPYMAPRQTVEFFGPVAASMEAALKRPIRLESVQTLSAFKRALKLQVYDIALIQPFDFPKVVNKYGYLPLAQFSRPLVSQFYVRNDSRYHHLDDLRGTTIAMPAELSANSRIGMRVLYDNKLIPGRDVKLRFFNSHDSCLQQVWAGTASACSTVASQVQIFETRMQARLRPIHDARPIPHVLFVVSSRVPADERAKLQQVITGWVRTEQGRALLKNLGFSPGFILPKTAEYARMDNYAAISSTDHMSASAIDHQLVLGVFPFLTARQLARNFAPVLPALSRASHVMVHLRTATNFESFREAIRSAAYDIVLVQPFDYATAAHHGYLPLAAMKEPAQGTFFVLRDSPFKQITDFKGHEIAMPPIESAQGYLGRLALRQAGLVPGRDVTINYRPTHDSCLRQVQQKLAVACITSTLVLPMVPASIGQGLRSVGVSKKIPGAVFMVHRRLSPDRREQLRTEILSWNHIIQGKKILRSIGLGEFVPVNVSLYRRLSGFD